MLTFSEYVVRYPEWFTLLEKQAYCQVIVINVLSLYYLWRDPEEIYFVLIRKRIKTKELWGDGGDDGALSVVEDKSDSLLGNDNCHQASV